MRFNQLSISLFTILFLLIILPAELTPINKIERAHSCYRDRNWRRFPNGKKALGLTLNKTGSQRAPTRSSFMATQKREKYTERVQ